MPASAYENARISNPGIFIVEFLSSFSLLGRA